MTIFPINPDSSEEQSLREALDATIHMNPKDFDGEEYQYKALREIFRKFSGKIPESLIKVSIDAIRDLKREYFRAILFALIAPKLSDTLKCQVLREALSEVKKAPNFIPLSHEPEDEDLEDEINRNYSIYEILSRHIIPELSESMLSEAFDIAKGINNKLHRNWVLNDISCKQHRFEIDGDTR